MSKRSNDDEWIREEWSNENGPYLSRVYNLISDPICVKDRKHRWVSVNDKFCEISGTTREELLGKSDYDIFPKEEADVFWEMDEEVFETHEDNISKEFLTNSTTGKTIFLNTKKTLLINELGDKYILAIGSDITEHKLTEKALTHNQNFLNSIIDQSPFATWISDAKGTIIKCNTALTKLLNITDEQLVGKYNVFEDQIAIEQGLIPKIRTVFEDGKTTNLSVEWDAKELGYHESNKVFIEGTMFPIHDDKGKLTNVVNHWIDVTKRKQAEKDKEKLEYQLRQAQKMEAIGTMAGGIAHDFNNILAAILGYTEMIQSDITTSSHARHSIDQVLKAGHRAKELVNHILTFSRMSHHVSDHIPISLSSIIKEVIQFQRSLIPTTIAIMSDIDKNCGHIKGDSIQIHQVMMNLCTNAAHAMENHGGTLEVTLHETELSSDDLNNEADLNPGSYIKLSVRDTGTGLTQELMEKIFDPYFTTKEVGKGTGIGLSVVHGIVISHNGFITVESEIGMGSTFNIFFPMIEEDSIAEDAGNTEEIPTGTERILFIDDEIMLADIGKSIIEMFGYSVTAKTDSREALNLFKKNPSQFDLVITDQSMPNIPGSELARQMIEIRPDIPIIMCTGHSGIINKVKAQKMGIKEFTMKPVEKTVITKLIRKVLDTAK